MITAPLRPFVPQKGWIQGCGGTKEVWLNGRILSPRSSLQVRNHSPNGFSWGYVGSGPSQLALAICLKLTDYETALALYQEFKAAFIARCPMEQDFALAVAKCQAWLETQKEALACTARS